MKIDSESVHKELRSHHPSRTPGVCSRAGEAITERDAEIERLREALKVCAIAMEGAESIGVRLSPLQNELWHDARKQVDAALKPASESIEAR